MANTKSAEKRIRTNEKRRARNASMKSAMRTAMKKVEIAVANQDAEAAKEALKLAVRKLDKAVTKGLIHKNTANRHKSLLAKKVNALIS
ncbi:30S ribosomal protein S20 [Caldibacillus debilis]|uniref:30S ribosomal protein S20 n=1 Tax=Caldibacillus debilis TaxID=301148 RepID=UPI002FD9243A